MTVARSEIIGLPTERLLCDHEVPNEAYSDCFSTAYAEAQSTV